MSTYYAVATGNWSSSSVWSATSGGAGGAGVPGAADTVIFNAASGAITVTVSAAASCLTCDFSGGGSSNFTGTFVIAANVTLTVAGATLKLVSTMTYTLGSTTTSQIYFNSNSGGTVAWTTGGKTFGYVIIGVSSGTTVTLQDSNTLNASAVMTLTTGGLNTNGQTCSWGSFLSSNNNTRSLTLGASSITLTSNATTAWDINNSAGMTFSAGTSTLTFTNTGNGAYFGNVLTYNNIVITNTGAGSFTLQGTTASFANVTYNGSSSQGNSLSVVSSFTVTGAFTVTGNSANVRSLILSSTVGTSHIITAATVSLSNADFQDITAAGASPPWTGASLGDCGGNSNITFTTARTLYGVAAGNFSASATWSLTSGGAGGQNPPLPQDSVNLDNNSAAGTYFIDTPRVCSNFNCTGFTRTLGGTASLTFAFYGNVTLGASMTFTISGAPYMYLSGRGSYTLTTNGILIPYGLTVSCPGGTYTLGSALNVNYLLNVLYGGFATANYNVSCSGVTSNSGNVRSITLGTSTVTCINSWSFGSGGMTFSGASSTIVMGPSSGGTFAGAGLTYGNLTFSAADSHAVTGNNTFNTVTVPSDCAITWPAGGTQTITTLSATGQNNGYLSLPGVAGQYVNTPSAAPVALTGDITIDAHVALTNWQSGNQAFLTKWGASGLYSFEFYISSTGQLALATSANGTAITYGTSSVPISTPNGSATWLRASKTGTVVTFYTSPDGATWTQLGTAVTGTSTLYNTTSDLEIGTNTSGNGLLAKGNFYEVKLYSSGLGSSSGTPVFDANFTTKTFGANSFTESSSNAATVTINGAIAQASDGRVQFASSTAGTASTLSCANSVVCNYMVLQDSTASGAGAPFYAGDYSVNSGNNTNWNFYNPPLYVSASTSVSVSTAITKTNAAVRTASTSVSVTTAAARAATFARLAATTVTVSTAANRASSGSRTTATTTVTIATAATRAEAESRTTSVTITVSTAAVSGHTLSRTIANSVTISSAANRASSGSRTAANTVTINGVAARATTRTRTAATTVTISTNAARTQTRARTAATSVTINSAATRAPAYTRTCAANVAVSALVTRAGMWSRTAATSISVSTTAIGQRGASRTATSSFSVATTAQVGHHMYSVYATQSVPVSGALVAYYLPRIWLPTSLTMSNPDATATMSAGLSPVSTMSDPGDVAALSDPHPTAVLDG